MKSLITTPLQVQVTNRPFWKPRNKEENGKGTLFPSHCYQQNILGKLWVLAETLREEEKNFETISWSLFLKSCICSSLHLLWLAFLQISRHPRRRRARCIGPPCYVALNYIGDFIAHLLPPISPDCLTILCFCNIKDRPETWGRILQLQIEHDITHWQRLTIWLVLWKRSDCTVTRVQRKKKSLLWSQICKNVIPIIHWQVVITISDD